ncbi:Heme A synthase [Paenibacillus plantiphilus]|uniref:Heme A synthase n=1 Tax=Paenibacillus plantiphilus TaxID=2905650 RepID=A0ABM9CHF0_9BACL|nr:heme A synthase [Paenibacillus plantiphilus]CAH1211610.1 Heme A synthase [Paenibacillus plantiphilus]
MIALVSSRYRSLAAATCIGMLIVLLAGALVTNTDSGLGCGDDWPLCHGKFIPAYTVESLIEYSHRLVSGIVGLLVLAIFIMTLVRHRTSREAVFYASSAGFFTVLQALLGAAAVKWPQSPSVMALHFGFSIMAFASTLLLLLWANRMKRGSGISRPAVGVPRSVMIFSLSILIYSYFVIYLGAFIRHTESAGGCLGWPLCNGEVIPEWEGATRIVFIHRLGAMVIFILIGWLALHVNRVCKTNRGLRLSATIAFVLVLCQVLSGAWLTATIENEDWFLFTSMFHNIIISGLFGVLADLTIRSWKWREGREKE